MKIPRLLVPFDARPPTAEDCATQRRRPTTLDVRTLVPAMLPIVQLDGHSNIPSNLPLDSIAARVVVPRDIKPEAYRADDRSTAIPLQPTELDVRVTVPQGSAPPEITPLSQRLPGDLVERDVFLTGEVQLLATPKSEAGAKSEMTTRISSIAFHILLVAVFFLGPKLFPPHVPTKEEEEIARQQITLLLPPGALDAPKAVTPPKERTSEAIRVDPRVLRKVAPPIEPEPLPGPKEPDRVVKNLPNTPVPQLAEQPPLPQPNAQAPKMEAPKAPLKLETLDQQPTPHGLLLPKTSPGRAIEDSARAAAKMSNPKIMGGDLPGGTPGGGGKTVPNFGVEILSPTEGVDFTNYLQRVYVTVQRNWYAVMPPSVQLGDRGIVVLRFKIMHNGSVPTGEPIREQGSGKEPLDRAAVSSIRASNPFEPLPSAFNGEFLELRFAYYYNIPPELVH